jgi:hypothetical protein
MESAAFADRLRYVVQHATQDHEITDWVAYELTRDGGEIVLRENGALVESEQSTDILFELFFKRIHQRAIAALPDDIRIHAASGIHNDRMFLLVGDPHSGKTTLALHLLGAGMHMVGDELVMLRDGLAVAFPRKFYPRENSFDLLPDLRSHAPAALPLVYGGDGMRRMAVDPTVFGRPWHIARLPVSAIFYLDPDFGSQTTARRSTKIDMVRLVMEQCAQPRSGRAWIGDLCGMVNAASTHVLSVGELDSALAVIRDRLEAPAS